MTEADLVAAAVISGNRNFEGRVHPQVRANYLASPMLVVAYALAGSVNVDLTKEPVGYDKKDKPVYLKDIWPSPKEIAAAIRKAVKASSFKSRYGDVFDGDANWKKVKLVKGQTYQWDIGSTYVKNPPYFDGMKLEPAPVKDISGARVLALFGDSITTDHISPAGNIKATSPAGVYLQERQVSAEGFQFLWLAPRQSRSDGARHLRQYPHQKRDDGRQGRRQHALLPPTSTATGEADVDLRRRRCATRRTGWTPWWSAARNMAPARRATGRPRVPSFWACAP